MLNLAVVWHFWMGLLLGVGAIGLLAAVIAGYIIKVQAPQYPKKP